MTRPAAPQRPAQQQTTAMAIIDPQTVPLAAQHFGEERIQLLAEQIGRGWKQPPTPAELELIATICKRVRLDPFARPPQIYFIKRWDGQLRREVITPQTGIDGMRLVAHRSREYMGPAGTYWCGTDGEWRDIWLDPNNPPAAARVGVYKRGVREPLFATALWAEWAQWQDEYAGSGDNRQKTGNKVLAPFWHDKPAHMLAKVAETMILKKAFPQETDELELAHLEEMDRLEAPLRVAMYEHIYGKDEDHAFAELPAHVPTRERDVEDRPRAALAAPPVQSGGVIIDPDPSVARRKRERGDLLEQYSALLSQARRSGAVDDAASWVLRSDTPEAEIIERGRQLRATVNAFNMERSRSAPQQQSAPGPDDADLEELPRFDDERERAQSEPAPAETAAQPKTKMAGVRSQVYQQMAELLEEAARLEVDFDDVKVAQWPIAEEEAIRRVERLRDRVDAKKRRLAGEADAQPPEQAKAF